MRKWKIAEVVLFLILMAVYAYLAVVGFTGAVSEMVWWRNCAMKISPDDAEYWSDALCDEPEQEPTVEELIECMRAYAEVASPSSVSLLMKTCADRMERMSVLLDEKQENCYADLKSENEKLKAKYGVLMELYHGLIDKVCSVLP